MSSLIVAHDLHIMMLEVSLDKVHVPRSSPFETALVKQTVVMFRLLDRDWTSIMPQRADHRAYRGSNREDETFEGGRSLVFSVPEVTLERPMEGPLHLQVHVRKELSRYFELEPCQSVGFVLLRVEHLFNGIIRELLAEREDSRREPEERNREPISRSLKGRFKILDENLRDNGAFLDLYARLSYFGKSIVTKIESADTQEQLFYLGTGASPSYHYWARETMLEELQSGCWAIKSEFSSSKRTNLSLSCGCDPSNEDHADHHERTVVRAELAERQSMGYDEQLMTPFSEETIMDERTESRQTKKGKRDYREKGVKSAESTEKRKSEEESRKSSLTSENGINAEGENSSKGSVMYNLPKNVKARKIKEAQNEQTEHEKTGKPGLDVKSKMNDKRKASAKSIEKFRESASSRLATESTENKIDAEYSEGNDVNPPTGRRIAETIGKKDTGQWRVHGRSLHRRPGAGAAVTGAAVRKVRRSTCHGPTSSHQPFSVCRQPALCHPCESHCTYHPSASSHVTCWPGICLRTNYCVPLCNGGLYSC